MQKKSKQQSSKTEGRVPPHNKEAEQAVLASLMTEDKTFDKIVGVIDADDFYYRNNGVIFETIFKLYESGEAYDLTLVSSALKAAGLLEQVGGLDYLAGLTFIIPNPANIVNYAQKIKSKAKLRQLISTASRIHELAYEFDQDITKDAISALDESGQMIFELSKDSSNKDPKQLAYILNDVYEELEAMQNREDGLIGVPTGFYDIDHMTNGLQAGALVIIAGRPAMGKTSFALNIAQNAAKSGKTVAVFSLEMTSSQLVQRIISSETEVPNSKIQSGKLTVEDWQTLANVGNELSNMKIFIDDTSSIPVMEIRSKCRRLKSHKEHGLDLIIIDYLQLMENKRIDQREQQIADISRNLKALAKELEVPVIALSQLNRSVESRTDKRPLPSDLRESGAIEQDADLIMFIYRDEVYHKDTLDKGIAEIIIAKHRNGPTGIVKLNFENQLTKFRNTTETALKFRSD